MKENLLTLEIVQLADGFKFFGKLPFLFLQRTVLHRLFFELVVVAAQLLTETASLGIFVSINKSTY